MAQKANVRVSSEVKASLDRLKLKPSEEYSEVISDLIAYWDSEHGKPDEEDE